MCAKFTISFPDLPKVYFSFVTVFHSRFNWSCWFVYWSASARNGQYSKSKKIQEKKRRNLYEKSWHMLIDLNWFSFLFSSANNFSFCGAFSCDCDCDCYWDWTLYSVQSTSNQLFLSSFIHSFRSAFNRLFRASVCLCDILLFWRYNKFAYLIYLPFNQFIYLFGICRCVSACLYVCLMLFMAQTNSTIAFFSPNAMDYSFRTNFVHSIHSIENLFTFILLFIYIFFVSFHFSSIWCSIFNLRRCYFLISAQHFESWMWFVFFVFFFFFYIYAIHTFSQFDEFKILMAMHIIFTFGFTIRAHTTNQICTPENLLSTLKKGEKKTTHTHTNQSEREFVFPIS